MVLVLCGAGVVCTWLLSRPTNKLEAAPDANLIAENYRDPSLDTATDWQKILTGVATTQGSTTIASDGTVPDDTTVTAQLSKDLFSRYLAIAKGGDSLSASDLDQVAEQTLLSSSQYTQVTGATYVTSNLHITTDTSLDALRKYRDTGDAIIKKRTVSAKEDPLTIFGNATQDDNPDELTKLDPFIADAKALISDLLTMTVPKDVVTLHLAVLNSYSNVLADLQAMRGIYTDPVKSFASISQYSGHISDLQKVLTDIKTYIVQKVGDTP